MSTFTEKYTAATHDFDECTRCGAAPGAPCSWVEGDLMDAHVVRGGEGVHVGRAVKVLRETPPCAHSARVREASTFERACDELGRAFEDAEHAVADLGLGVSASVVLEDGHTRLWFAKSGRTWGLYVTGYDEDPRDGIGSASVSVRVECAGRLGELLDALLRASREREAEVGAAVALVEGVTQRAREMLARERARG